jgi:hypothetical protein
VTIGRYQFSIVLILIAAIASPLVFAATYYIWNSKTVPFHPGQNATIDVTISNSANINYFVQLVITLSDTNYQQSYVQVSSQTYTIVPGDNAISAWIAVSQDAPNSQQQLTVDFLRL